MVNTKYKLMKDFFPIETPYSSEDYKIMKNVVDTGIDSHLEGFTKSEFKKSPTWNNKFLWNIHMSEMPILYRRLEELFKETGNYDYQDFLDSVKEANKETAVAEMIDPYDPMDSKQTITGQPTQGSDLFDDSNVMPEAELSEEEVREMIRKELYGAQEESLGTLGLSYDKTNKGIENYIDDDTLGQELAAENSSDSLMNQHGTNAKPSTLDEEWGQRYENVAFAQGDDADEALSALRKDGPEAALAILQRGHYPGEHDASPEPNHGKEDNTFEKDGYILSWNPRLNYIGLQYDTNYQIAEDSLAMRHRADQRGKIGNVPLGQHAPHSQAAIKENKK